MESKYDIELRVLREQLDEIDDQLIRLLLKRFDLTANVGILKMKYNKEIIDSSREIAIINKIEEQVKGLLNTQNNEEALYIVEVYKEIMKQSKMQQGKE